MRKGIVVVALIALALAGASAATAADWHLARLDAVASSVAGHPVSVYCEGSRAEWVDVERHMGFDGDSLAGFTFNPGVDDPFGNLNMVYIEPSACEALHVYSAMGWGAIGAANDAGLRPLGTAGLTLVHEAVHQRGVSDEGQTECAAYRMMPTLWTSQFGVKPKIWTWARVGRRMVHRFVANPTYTRLMAWTKADHNSLPSQYRTVC
jgi:hypothetical protein